MAIKKIALLEDVLPQVVPAADIAADHAATERFKKVIADLQEVQKKEGRKLVPKVNDFLYASCIMMHAAEAALIDQRTGEPLLNKEGKPVEGGFTDFVDHKGQQSVKWSSPDGIKPYKNGNGDIFPEEDLLKAYKDWVGKPLCRDHVSDTIEGVRGVIVDTYYDPKFKRVHALFALDKVNYGELARKIEAGYATSVSMGTAVGRSICTECGNVATTEAEYCIHVKGRQCYGEVNKDLSPIELSIVVTGADPAAKIKTIVAHLKEYESNVNKLVENGKINASEAEEVRHTISDLKKEVNTIKTAENELEINEEAAILDNVLSNIDVVDSNFDKALVLLRKFIAKHGDNLSLLPLDRLNKLVGVLNHLQLEEKSIFMDELLKRAGGNEDADVQVGQEEVRPDLVDSQGDTLKSDTDISDLMDYSGKPGDITFGNEVPQQFASLYVKNIAKTTNDNKLSQINSKIAALAEQLSSLQTDLNKEKPMTFSDLKKKALERKSYFQGTEDPSQVLPYDRMGDDHKVRESEDKQMVGDELDTAANNPDMEEKKMLQRAELEKRMASRAAMLKKIEAELMSVKNPQTGQEKVVEKKPDGSVSEYVAAVRDGKKKKDDDEESDEKSDKKSKKHDKDHDNKKKKKAYYQGTEMPTPGSPQYERMVPPDQDELRGAADRQMTQTGDLGGMGGLVPGDEDLKKGLQRIANKKLSAKFFKGASAADSRWEFSAGTGSSKEVVLSLTASQAYGDELKSKVKVAGQEADITYSDFFHSKPYGAKVMKLIRAQGPLGAAEELGLDEDMPEAELSSVKPEDESKDELSALRDAVSAGIEKIEVGLEEIKSAVVEEPASEGLADLDVELDGGEGEGDMPMPEVDLPEQLASATDKDMLEAYAFLTDFSGELAYMDTKLASRNVDQNLVNVAKEALADVDNVMTRISHLVKSYKRASLAKKAMGYGMMAEDADHAEDKMDDDCGDGMSTVKVVKIQPMADDHGDMANDYNREKEEMYALTEGEKEEVEDIAEEVAEEEKEDHEEEMHDDDGKDDGKDDDDNKAELEKLDELSKQLDDLHKEVEDLDKDHDELKKSLSSRKEWRKQLVATAAQYDDVYLGERASGGPTLDLEGDSKVETLHEVHDAMLDVATKDQAGPKVREAAKKLDNAIKGGAINANKLDELVAMGAVDAETVNYYKSFYGQVDGGSDFAGGLVQEFDKKASQDEGEDKIVRYKRAYMVGMAAQEKGLVARSSAALNDFVDNLVNVPDHVFSSIKNLVEQTKSAKTSVAAPQVGLNNDEQRSLTTTASQDNTEPTFENLSRVFLK